MYFHSALPMFSRTACQLNFSISIPAYFLCQYVISAGTHTLICQIMDGALHFYYSQMGKFEILWNIM